jgi:hypothetical protein
LQAAQTRCTTTERELLSIVETLKEFRNILLGQKIKVYTDHENLTYKRFNSDRVMRWRLCIEEYSPELQYLKGTHNVVADALSQLDEIETPMEDTQKSFLGLSECLGPKKTNELHFHSLNFKYLLKMQESDKSTVKILEKYSEKYTLQDFHGGGKTTALICHKNMIVVANCLQKAVL